MKNRFNKLLNEIAKRNEGQPIPGDYIKVRKDVKNTPWWKELSEDRKSFITPIIEKASSKNKPLYFSGIKSKTEDSGYPTLEDLMAYVGIEESPGYITNHFLIPIDLIEVLRTEHQQALNHTSVSEIKPNFIFKPQVPQTNSNNKHKGGTYNLPDKNYTSMYMK